MTIRHGYTKLIMVAVTVLYATGCTQEDHLLNYNNGGMYPSNPPTFGNDPSQIYFSSPNTGNGDIYVFDCEKRASRVVFSSSSMETSPVVASNGIDLFYETKGRGTSIIQCRNLQTGAATTVSNGSTFDELRDVATDGKQIIASCSKRTGGLGKLLNLMVISVPPNQMLPFELGPAESRFSSDGKWIVACRYDDQAHARIELLNRLCKVERVFGRGDYASFTSDHRLAIIRDATVSKIDVYQVDGTLDFTISPKKAIDLSASFAPHFGPDRVVFVAKNSDRREVWQMQYVGTNETKICALHEHTNAWTTHDNSALMITLTGRNQRVGSLSRIDYQRGVIEPLLDLAAP